MGRLGWKLGIFGGAFGCLLAMGVGGNSAATQSDRPATKSVRQAAQTPQMSPMGIRSAPQSNRINQAKQVTRLQSDEREKINARVRDFYKNPSAKQMDEASLKWSVRRGKPIKESSLHKALLLKDQPKDLLLRQAQAKATDEYQKQYCKQVLSKKFPHLKCEQGGKGGRATAKEGDLVHELLEGLMAKSKGKIEYDLDNIPVNGITDLPLWSDDYWRLQWGATSYRYATELGWEFENYDDAIAAYSQPEEWKTLISSAVDPRTVLRTIRGWSPAEKYDLTVGDELFLLTDHQKWVGDGYRTEESNDVESWMGICHGWAAAAIVVPKPTKDLFAVGPNGAQVHWYPHDVRAMASLNYANGESPSNSVGGRCNSKKVDRYENGRLKQEECFDTNPSTMVLALGNLVGRESHSFVMDKTFDYQVWNQPIYAYELTYFDPLNRNRQSKNWRDVVRTYDRNFKANDRFQNPLTRGKLMERVEIVGEGDEAEEIITNYRDDSGIKFIAGVMMTVVYLVEVDPLHGVAAAEDQFVRETYIGDLELHEGSYTGEYLALGGEWHENAHPDFLWVPQANQPASFPFDMFLAEHDVSKKAIERTTAVAQRASEYGYPLCATVKDLIEKSSGEKYACKLWE